MLNKESLERPDTIRNILFKKTTIQSASPTTAILRITFLQKNSVLKTEISSSSLSARNLIDNLIINQLTKFASLKLCISYINSSTRRKSAKTR